jgi:sigma-70, region 4
MYPSFMLYDLKAKELNLNQNLIEKLIQNSPTLTQNIYRLYYEEGFSQQLIAQELKTTPTTIQSHLQRIKNNVKILSTLWSNDLTLIIGRSGTGKSTLEEKLCKDYDLKSIRSYSTRPKRSPDEDSHIFINPSDVDKYPNKIATTTINGNFYFATKEQLDQSHIYVIDPIGLYELSKNFPDLTFNLIYLKLPKYKHQQYLENRRTNSNETPELQTQRLKSENQQFDEFEDKIKNNSLPKNINLIKKINLIPDKHK